MLHLILVRHGETEWNAQRRYQGQTDIPLSDLGVRQAELVAERLVGRKIEALYASDLERARETAEIIAEKNGLDILPEPCLREMKFGVLEGLTWDEAGEKYPGMISTWLGDYNQPPEGGETLQALSARVSAFLEEVKKKHDEQTILLVAHGGSLSELLRITLGLPFERRRVFGLDNASLSELILGEDGYPLLKRLNDICHLEALKP